MAHLEQTFPGREERDQRLIHAGRLLSADMLLQDVFGAQDLSLPPMSTWWSGVAGDAPQPQPQQPAAPSTAWKSRCRWRGTCAVGGARTRARSGAARRLRDEYDAWLQEVSAWRQEQLRRGNVEAAAYAERYISDAASQWVAMQAEAGEDEGRWRGRGAGGGDVREGAARRGRTKARRGRNDVLLKLAMLVFLLSRGASNAR